VPHRCSGNTSLIYGDLRARAGRISADKGLALRAVAARHAGCAGRRNCNVNLDDLDRDRPDLNCEPLQAPGTVRNLRLDETVVVRYGVSWRIPQLVGECAAKFGITWRVAAQLRAV
jgi:hypothetical protein